MKGSSGRLLFQSRPYTIDETMFSVLFRPIIARNPIRLPYIIYKVLPYLYIALACAVVSHDINSYLKCIIIFCCLFSGSFVIYARNLQRQLKKYEKKLESLNRQRANRQS